MKKSIAFGICALAGASFGASAFAMAGDGERPTREQQRAERLLEGKTAGPAQQCIEPRRINNTTIVDESTVLYRVNSELLYRTQFAVPCSGLDNDSTLITDVNSTQLCAGDQVRVVENPTGRDLAMCALGEFVPYRAQ